MPGDPPPDLENYWFTLICGLEQQTAVRRRQVTLLLEQIDKFTKRHWRKFLLYFLLFVVSANCIDVTAIGCRVARPGLEEIVGSAAVHPLQLREE